MEVVLKTLFSHGHGGIFAYIDPSTGSLIFQVLAASAISAGLFVKGLRERITWLITGGWRSKSRDAGTVTAQESLVAKDQATAESHRKAA